MTWTVLLSLLQTFGSFLFKHWKATLIVIIIGLVAFYVYNLRSENQQLTAQAKTLVAANAKYAQDELVYQQDIAAQNQSILALKALSAQQQAALNAAVAKSATDAQQYAEAIAKLRAEKFPTDCQSVMNLLLQKALEANGHG